MPREITPLMETHLTQEVTTLAACVKIMPSEDSLLAPRFLTEHDKPLVWEGNEYKPEHSFKISAIRVSRETTGSNCEITIFSEDETEAERFLDADVEVFLLNWQDTSPAMGRVVLFAGYVEATEYDYVKDELRLTVVSYGKKLGKKFLPKYSITCRTDVGSDKCMVPVKPFNRKDTWLFYPFTVEVGQQFLMPTTSTQALPNYSFSAWQSATDWVVNTATETLVYNNTAQRGRIETTNIARDASVGTFDVVVFHADIQSDVKVVLGIEQYDASNTLLEVARGEFNKRGGHNVSANIHLDCASLKFFVEADGSPSGGVSVKPYVWHLPFADIPTQREKLARIVSQSVLDEIDVANNYFYLPERRYDSISTDLPGWEVTYTNSSGKHTLDDGILANDMIIRQNIELPPLECDAYGDRCYFFDTWLDVVSGQVTVNLRTYDEGGNLLETFTATNGVSVRPSNASKIRKIQIEIIFGSTPAHVRSVKQYIYQNDQAAPSDGEYVTLTSASEKGTKNDKWVTVTEPVFWFVDITSIDALFTKQKFTVQTGIVPSDIVDVHVVFMQGGNRGLTRQGIIVNDTVELFSPVPKALNVGDKVLIYRACDKQYATCTKVFGNGINFRGEPFMPGAAEFGLTE